MKPCRYEIAQYGHIAALTPGVMPLIALRRIAAVTTNHLMAEPRASSHASDVPSGGAPSLVAAIMNRRAYTVRAALFQRAFSAQRTVAALCCLAYLVVTK